jgi:hypothetical protein
MAERSPPGFHSVPGAGHRGWLGGRCSREVHQAEVVGLLLEEQHAVHFLRHRSWAHHHGAAHVLEEYVVRRRNLVGARPCEGVVKHHLSGTATLAC